MVITGLESIGRSHDFDKLSRFLEFFKEYALLDPEAARHLKTGGWLQQAATAVALPVKDLLKEAETVEDEIKQEREQAARQELLSKAAPNLVNQIGGAAQEGNLPDPSQLVPPQ